MLIDILRSIFQRDLQRLYNEIELYRDDETLWKTKQGITNPGGNLCLHLIGNLQTYIGHAIGGFAYTRNRELEFSQQGLSKKVLLEMISDCAEKVLHSLEKGIDMEEEFPLLTGDEKKSIGYTLVHLSAHLTYHLGQINYHRRLLEH